MASSLGFFTQDFHPPRGTGQPQKDRNVAGTTFWADNDLLEQYFWYEHQADPARWPLGYIVNRAGQVRYVGIPHDDRHQILCAGSRGGKSESCLQPVLLTYPGSTVVIDPKGDLYKKTAQHRQNMGFEVFIFDPYAEDQQGLSRFNPLDLVDLQTDNGLENAGLLADALIIPSPHGDSHWTDAAKNFLRGLILFVKSYAPGTQRNLNTVWKLLTLPQRPPSDQESGGGEPQSFPELLDLMLQSDQADGIIRIAAASLSGKSDNERSSVISSAIEQLAFLDSPAMKRVLDQTSETFDPALLKTGKVSVFLSLPARRMGTHSRWLRLMIALFIAELEATPNIAKGPKKAPTETGYPILFILDEFAQLGPLSIIEKAAAYMAGFGVKLLIVVQDLTQLKKLYQDAWESFMANSGIKQFYAIQDLFTADYVSRLIGQAETRSVSHSEISESQASQGFTGESHSMTTVPIMSPDEVIFYFAREKHLQVVLIPGRLPMAINRLNWQDSAFQPQGRFHS